jgi:hypothetical protein
MIQNYFGKTYFADLIHIFQQKLEPSSWVMLNISLKKRPTSYAYKIRVPKIMTFLKSKVTAKFFYQSSICGKISC